MEGNKNLKKSLKLFQHKNKKYKPNIETIMHHFARKLNFFETLKETNRTGWVTGKNENDKKFIIKKIKALKKPIKERKIKKFSL